MFDIGFSELVLVFIIGLVVLGPQRLPVAVRTVVGWIRAMRSLAASVQNELANELKLQELQEGLKKVEKASLDSLSPELKASVEELKKTAESLKSTHLHDHKKMADEEVHTIHPQFSRHDDVTAKVQEHDERHQPEAEIIPAEQSARDLQQRSSSVVSTHSTQPSDKQ